MAAATDIGTYKDALIILATAAIVVPAMHRLRVGPILGFLAVGAALGPYGLGQLVEAFPPVGWFTVTGEKQIEFIAELGVVFLLFFIGLEVSLRRLITMRKLVFGLGGLQIVLTALAIGLVCTLAGVPPAGA